MNNKEHRARAWLENLSQDLDDDSEILESVSDEDLRAELQELGADVEGFHATLAARLRAAKLQQAGNALIKWLSPLWQPQWAGEFVGAGDIPKQMHRFSLEHGSIEISCSWRAQQRSTPAYLDLSWKADTILEGALDCRFVQPDTGLVLAEISLGASKEGGTYLTSQELGFDPSRQKWALVILVKQIEPVSSE